MHARSALVTAVLVLVAGAGEAQTPASPVPAAQGPKTLASTINVYAFPTVGQSPEQQSTDEASCYSWAVQNTGSDPFDLSKQLQAQHQQAQQTQQKTLEQQQQIAEAGKGAGAKGAVGGAAAGALIGEIASDDAGEGAAWGAAVGAIAARRHARHSQAEASQQVQQQGQQVQQQTQVAQQATTQQIENFKKAFSVCLEAKSYMVKF